MLEDQAGKFSDHLNLEIFFRVTKSFDSANFFDETFRFYLIRKDYRP